MYVLIAHICAKISKKLYFLKDCFSTFCMNVKLGVHQNYFLDYIPYYYIFISNFLVDKKHDFNRPSNPYKYRQKLNKITFCPFWPEKWDFLLWLSLAQNNRIFPWAYIKLIILLLIIHKLDFCGKNHYFYFSKLCSFFGEKCLSKYYHLMRNPVF